ncbi:MAG: hypothetical protein WCV82_00885 [Candidatus Paceibacterota bacterium]
MNVNRNTLLPPINPTIEEPKINFSREVSSCGATRILKYNATKAIITTEKKYTVKGIYSGPAFGAKANGPFVKTSLIKSLFGVMNTKKRATGINE